MSSSTAVLPSPFGSRLRQWRQHRGISQLELAGRVASTSRHVSFLETGRSRPSRQMVLRLCDALDLALRDRNELLHAAGLAGAYPVADLTGPDLAPYRAAIEQLMTAHDPYPATVVDGRWNVLFANTASQRLFGGDVVGSNIVRRFVANPAAAEVIENWAEVAWSSLARLRQQVARSPFDGELHELVELAERELAAVPRPAEPASAFVVCPWFRVGDEVVRTIGMVARFDPASEVTLDELRVELMYPQDAAAERFFRTPLDATRVVTPAAAREQPTG